MKVAFLIPPCYDNKFPAERSAGCTRIVYPMINIYELTAAAAVRELGGHSVSYHDFVFDNPPKEDFDKFIASDISDVYIIWTVNLSLESDLHAIGIIRKYHPDKPVILLGPGATYYIDKALKYPATFIVRGEPELTLLELLSKLADGELPVDVRGVVYRNAEGEMVRNSPRPLNDKLDELPFPARDLLAGRVYHNPKLKTGPYTTMFTSRNCPFHCLYCVPSSLTFAREIEYRRQHPGRKPPIGFRSMQSVEKEIDELAAQGYRAIGFMDDNFIWDEERTAGICRIMRKHGIVWGCQARVDAITEPIAKLLGESGCMYVDLGIESFDADILKYIKKGITPDDIRRAISLLKKYKVPVKLNVLIGSSPLETRRTVLNTLREAKRLDVDQVMFNIVSPFPGTEYYEICKENGWIKGGEYRPTDVQHESILDLPHISADEMERLLFRNNLSYFLSPRFIWKQMKRFSSWSELKAAGKALRIKLFH
ncbi:MAG: B12-binding domain-containing radical SAM protein [Prevotella sp.]|nr:B12-binding domain-containing radical SAM protein [Prevotella sp.]MCM1475409.1 B12-binding domain-containing radical SAM protein [Muribaculaceae bacterium]